MLYNAKPTTNIDKWNLINRNMQIFNKKINFNTIKRNVYHKKSYTNPHKHKQYTTHKYVWINVIQQTIFTFKKN